MSLNTTSDENKNEMIVIMNKKLKIKKALADYGLALNACKRSLSSSDIDAYFILQYKIARHQKHIEHFDRFIASSDNPGCLDYLYGNLMAKVDNPSEKNIHGAMREIYELLESNVLEHKTMNIRLAYAVSLITTMFPLVFCFIAFAASGLLTHFSLFAFTLTFIGLAIILPLGFLGSILYTHFSNHREFDPGQPHLNLNLL